MSWFDGSGLKSFALSAFNEAQKHIDKVLDIQEEENAAKMAIRDKKQRKDDNKKEEVSTTASSTREKVAVTSPPSKIASSPTRRPGKKKSEKSTTPKKESSDFSWDSLFADEPKSLPTPAAEAGDEMSSKRASSPRKRVGSRTSVEKRVETQVEKKVDVAAEKTEVEIRKDGDDVITMKTDDERAIESVESDAVLLPVKKEEEEERGEEEVSVTSASSEIEGIHPMEIKDENKEKEVEDGEESSLNERAGEDEKEEEEDEELSVQVKEEILTSDPMQTITDKVSINVKPFLSV